jgi:hypothetical protein
LAIAAVTLAMSGEPVEIDRDPLVIDRGAVVMDRDRLAIAVVALAMSRHVKKGFVDALNAQTARL